MMHSSSGLAQKPAASATSLLADVHQGTCPALLLVMLVKVVQEKTTQFATISAAAAVGSAVVPL